MFEYCASSMVFKFANDSTSHYVNEVFEFSPEFSINFRNEFLKLKHPFPKSWSFAME